MVNVSSDGKIALIFCVVGVKKIVLAVIFLFVLS